MKNLNSSKDTTRLAALLITTVLVALIGLQLGFSQCMKMAKNTEVIQETRSIAVSQLAEAGMEEAIYHLLYDDGQEWVGWEKTDPNTYVRPASQLTDAEGNPLGEFKITIVTPETNDSPGNDGSADTSLASFIKSTGTPTVTVVAGVPNLFPGSEIQTLQVVGL